MFTLLFFACAPAPLPATTALSYLQQPGRIKQVLQDDFSMSHVRVQQEFQGIPVWGAEAVVHLSPDGSLSSITDAFRPVSEIDPTPYYTAEEATGLGIDAVGGWARVSDPTHADLWVFPQGGVDHLAWRVDVPMLDDSPSEPVLFVDAHTGEVLFQYENLQTSCSSSVGTGTAYYSGAIGLNTCKYTANKYYYLEDTTDDFETLSFGNSTTRVTYLADTDNKWTAATQKISLQAHYNTGKVIDYYASTFGRNGIDDAGGPGFVASLDSVQLLLTSAVSYSKNYNNAFWSSGIGVMVYGDGDGKAFDPLVSVDVSGHEMTHGVVQYTAGLVYTGESGGLNEAYADIFGAMIERYVDGNVTSADTWTIAEDAYTPKTAGDALRYMNNPAKDKHSLDYYVANASKYDVHYSSGIANLAFYLLSEGGAHPTRGGAQMTGIGADEASEIWFWALEYYLLPNATFADARTATLAAAKDLYGSGSAEYAAVASSWTMVGL